MRRKNSHFEDKNVIITGGSSGIGKATAELLAAEGANVFIVARDRDKLDRALQEIRDRGSAQDQRYGAFSADVTSYQEIEDVIAEIVEADGTPDILVNSAGIVYPGHFNELPLSTFRKQMDVNYFGTLHTAKAVAPCMMERGSGHIVNISSFGGVFGAFGYSAYAASKFAVCGFTETLRAELKPHGVAVSLVFPPDTDTPQLREEQKVRPLEIAIMSGTGKPARLEGPGEHIAFWLAKTVLSDNGDPMSADEVASAILRGLRGKRFLIFPDPLLKVAYYLRGLLVPVANWAQDRLATAARRQRAGH